MSHSGNVIVLAFGIQTPLDVGVEICNKNIDHLELSKTIFSEIEVTSLNSN